jgi:hypothetical protein
MASSSHVSPGKMLSYLKSLIDEGASERIRQHCVHCRECDSLRNLIAWLSYLRKEAINTKSLVDSECILDAILKWYDDGSSSLEETNRIEVHIANCKKCSGALEIIRHARTRLPDADWLRLDRDYILPV